MTYQDRATAHKIDGEWVALPELTVDLFIGIMQPNEQSIREGMVELDNAAGVEISENKVLYGKLDFFRGNGPVFVTAKEDGNDV